MYIFYPSRKRMAELLAKKREDAIKNNKKLHKEAEGRLRRQIKTDKQDLVLKATELRKQIKEEEKKQVGFKKKLKIGNASEIDTLKRRTSYDA